MQTKPVYLTAEGKQKLEAELLHLRSVRRKEVAERIKIALESADPVGNPEYEEAKTEMGFIEGRIKSIENMLANAVLFEITEGETELVRIGSEVVVKNEDGEEEQYTIVGKAEADPRKGLISNESPIGQALLGKRPGDVVEVEVPGGTLTLTILRTY